MRQRVEVMLSLNMVMQTADTFFVSNTDERLLQAIKARYECVQNSIVYLRGELEKQGHDVAVTVQNSSITVVHNLYGYSKCEQFLKGHETDLDKMVLLRDFMSNQNDIEGIL
jgi:hypothetical protein